MNNIIIFIILDCLAFLGLTIILHACMCHMILTVNTPSTVAELN